MIIQGSPEWFAIRCGKVTASRISDLMATTAKGWGAGRANYAAQLVAERLTGAVEPSFTNAAMQWGNDKEPEARDAYCFFGDHIVTEIGFVDHPSIDMSGASPDGLVGDDGLVEIKCPNTATHIASLLDGKVPTKYSNQMQWQMACTGRQWCDFVSFDPRMPERMRLFVRRVERDNERIIELEAAVIDFLMEVKTTVANLDALFDPIAIAGAEFIHAG